MCLKSILTLFCIMFAFAMSSMVELNSQWRPNFGWDVTCSWTLYANDSLQSVRLYKADQQFLIYRPERDGPKRSALIRLPNIELRADCYETKPTGVTGKCVMSLEVLQPVREDLSYTCEVSGERPTFRQESKGITIEPLVPPSDAVVEKISETEEPSLRVNVNCSSSGMPAPTLVWSIGDQKIHQDFSGGEWNFTSKLYQVWSSLSYTLDGDHAVCTPEVAKGGRVVKGRSAQYSSASVETGATAMVLCILSVLNFIR